MHIAANLLGAATALTISATLTSGADQAAEWLQLIERFGAMAVLLAYMLLKDWITWGANAKRYRALEDRLNKKDEFIQTQLMAALKEATTVQNDSKTLLQTVKSTLDFCPQEVKDVHQAATVRATAPVREAGSCPDFGKSQCQFSHG